MSYANAIIGLGVGIAAVILIIAIACYVIFSYAHMKALKALGYDKAWLAWIPYGCTFACADAAAKDEDPVELFGKLALSRHFCSNCGGSCFWYLDSCRSRDGFPMS